MKASATDTSEKTPLSPPNDEVTGDLLVSKFEVANDDVLEDLKIPADKLNVVLLVMMMHGIGTLIAWNSFITIAPSVSFKFSVIKLVFLM